MMLLIGQMVVLGVAVSFMLFKGAAPSNPPRHAKHAAASEEGDESHGHHAPSPDQAHAPEAPADGGTQTAALHDEPKPATPPAADSAKSFDDIINQLVAGNARFVEGATRTRDMLTLRGALSGRERADAVIVTCTDSRLSPELIFDQPLGSLAVFRVPGAQVDAAVIASVDEAVRRLRPKAVLLMGHLECHHVDSALAKAPRSKVQRPKNLPGALGGVARMSDETRPEASAIAATSFAAEELRTKSPALRMTKDTSVLRLLYVPKTGQVRWLDAESAAAPHAQR